jgi:hypothetical protein
MIMKNRSWKPDHFALPILVALLLMGPPAIAQQPQEQQPQPPPAPAPAGESSTKPQNGADTKDKEKKDGAKRRSKLEQETGTVNDRIFEVMPNYGTVENAKELPALRPGQKFRLATAGALDYFTFPFVAALAALDQAHNSPPSWGQGWGAYGKRYGSTYADNEIGTYMTTAVFPTILREDPRYYQRGSGNGSVGRRAFYSLNRLFVTRTDSGHHRFNYSELFGNAAAAALSNVYHPAEDRTFGRNAGTLGMLLMWDGASNALKEFWPDIRRKVFHKDTP